MKTKHLALIACFIPSAWAVHAQQTDSVWTLSYCIEQASNKNLQVQSAQISVQRNDVSVLQAKAARYPSLGASAGQTFAAARQLNVQNEYGNYSNNNSSSYSISSNLTLFNGFKTRYNIEQANLNATASRLDAQTTQDDVVLQVLNAYLQVLYAQEALQNSRRQLEQTTEQLRLASERLQLGSISKSDHLQVKSEQASEQATVANAEKNLAMSKVSLLQLLNLPVSTSFSLEKPAVDDALNQHRSAIADSVYALALESRPSIKRAQISVSQAETNVKIAQADYYPKLSLNGQIATGYAASLNGLAYNYQVQNRVIPSLGLSLSIPIYQNRAVKSSVARAQLDVKSASISAEMTKNTLRKSIEQACVDVHSSQQSYDASNEAFKATNEALQVASEKFTLGMINSVDFLVQKNRLISAESNLLQAKYSLIFSYKTLDFYQGTLK